MRDGTMNVWFFRLLVLVMSLVLVSSAPGAPARGLEGAASPATLQQGVHNVELVGQLGGAVRAVAIRDNYAYIGVGPRLVILDISNPAQPAAVGQSVVLPGIVEGVAVAGDYACLANWYSGLRIVDVSDPAQPVETGGCDTPSDTSGVAVAGNYAYAADREGGVVILRVTPQLYLPLLWRNYPAPHRQGVVQKQFRTCTSQAVHLFLPQSQSHQEIREKTGS